MLMRAAGASGDLPLVLGLREEMQREGLKPCAVGGLLVAK
jgi:pentatricopeptide repeat protein